MGRRRATVCVHGHRYTAANRFVDRAGKSRCRRCMKAGERARKRDYSYRMTARCSGCGWARYPTVKIIDRVRVSQPVNLCRDCRRARREALVVGLSSG